MAALLTAVCWAFNSVVFTMVGKRIGASSVNHLRLWSAFIVLCGLHLVMFRSVFPFEIGSQHLKNFLFLSVSGVIGLAAGDLFFYESLLRVGPRLATLVMLLAPVLGAFLAWILLGEFLVPAKIIGMIITMAGILWVVLERVEGKEPAGQSPHYVSGILLSVGGAIGQALGLLLSRMGMEGGISVISANHIRITSAAAVMAAAALFRGEVGSHVAKLKNKKIFLALMAGVISGPVIGIILSLIAITHTQIGTASTLMSISPVLLIPVSYFLFGEKVSFRAILGTMIALAGIILLFLN
ncbi:MAG: DMT family transporter [Candidatus Omnitrophota bacterium]